MRRGGVAAFNVFGLILERKGLDPLAGGDGDSGQQYVWWPVNELLDEGEHSELLCLLDAQQERGVRVASAGYGCSLYLPVGLRADRSSQQDV
ncbi:MAG: hypothetical protein OXH19_05615 [Chloroflexi bacterium]|nr:hypothetical protein [Chloroflexota bacterium]MCY3589947.1 hypothetical protein [Chloroflexota bacterium]MCY3684612.1 hypothetical protein [Chloroflexota bacterium]MDE2709992.1 hypothetical protein [Chloroflexota bacterium]